MPQPVFTTHAQLQQQQQEVPAATNAPADADAFRAAFLAENTADDAAQPDDASVGAAQAEEPGEPASVVEDDADDTDGAGDADGSTEDGEADAALPADLTALDDAIKAGDPERFIAALGAKAADLLGAKAHKALRATAREIKQTRDKLLKASADLKTQFGDPAAARKAAAEGNADAFVESVEKFFGAPWADCMKFVNASFAGKPARLEAKAQQERQTQQAAETQRQAAAVKVRESITEAVKKGDAKLLKAHPAIVDLVFEKMRAGFKTGCDTPAKALAAVKKDLKAQHDSLAGVFSEPARKATTQLRQPTVTTGARGRPMTDEEFRADFIRQEQRAARTAGGK